MKGLNHTYIIQRNVRNNKKIAVLHWYTYLTSYCTFENVFLIWRIALLSFALLQHSDVCIIKFEKETFNSMLSI